MSIIAKKVLEATRAEPLTREEAPGLYNAMEDVATKLKLKMPVFHVIPEMIHPHPMLNALANSSNALSLSSTDIAITKPLLRLFEAHDLNKPISAELKAVLAHEMHHSSHRASAMSMRLLPIFALPLVAVTAMHIYDKAHAKAKKEGDISPENVVKHVDAATKETESSLPPETKDSAFFKKALHAGKYVAVAAIGLGAGLFAARHGSRYHEFAADLFGANSVVDKEIMVNALRKILKELGQSVSEHPEAQKFKGIIAETIQAHPSFAERAAHIRRH